jgi:alpha-glucosidase
MNRTVLAAAAAAFVSLLGFVGAQQQYSLRSPDARIEVRITAGDQLAYDVLVADVVVVTGATLSLTIDGQVLGKNPKVTAATPREHDGWVEPAVRQKQAKLRERYRELRLDCAGLYAVVFRAYDEGIAYRFETELMRASVTVDAETAVWRFAGNHTVYYPEEQDFFSHNERHFLPRALADLGPQNLGSLPAVVDAGGVKVAIAEADLVDYPGLWLRGTDGSALSAAFPAFPQQEVLRRDRDLTVTAREPFLAKTTGARTYPWRLLGIARRDGDLLTNPLVWLLQRPSEILDTSWIRPGKVAWDWWNANNLHGVDFTAGVNTATYLRYIDFAAATGIEYVILDEGWYVLGDLLQTSPGMDLDAIAAHAKERGVGLILWVVWTTLGDQLEPALDRFAQWGVRGIKVDFMQRDDQPVVDYYHRICREAAKRHLLVDFHGSLRPALMTRTWPNLLSVEGVRGLEWNKWSAQVHPEHDATLPFTRMFLGPMDYTPGAMRNAARGEFAPAFAMPMSQGTRCHQLALYVVYESPLQMLADSPSAYEREPDALAFLRAVPAVWDETRVLDARIGDYVVVARRRGDEWFLGAITDWTARDVDVPLSFLADGEFELEQWADGPNAARAAVDCKRSTVRVGRTGSWRVHLAEGGGAVARLRPVR